MTSRSGQLRAASPYALGALLTVTGATHFLLPSVYDGIVPPFLPPSRRFWTLASGAAELLCAGGLLARPTRARAAVATAGLFVAVFPANAYMVAEPGPVPRWAVVARLPLQVPLVLWAWSLRRRP